MKLLRFSVKGEDKIRFGVVDGETVFEAAGDIFGEFKKTDASFTLDRIRILNPVMPGKIIAIGVNYKDHAEEFNKELPENPLIFMKPPSSIIGPHDVIIYPDMSKRVDYEAELGVVIGRRASRVGKDDALDYVLGYTCLNDVTARDLQGKDGQWIRAKGFDTFCPIGPVIETELDPFNVNVESYLNGEKRQSSNTSFLVFPVPVLIEFISHVMTLEPGDVIATGTPSGVGPMKPGDSIEIRIEGIGSLVNTVGA